jgi:hypothetical protein
MIIAAIKWEAVVALASGVGVIISLVVAWTARSTAAAAKAQAEAAEAQADAAVKQAEIAERTHALATEPRLRIGRLPDGSANVHDPVPLVYFGDGPITRSDRLRIEIENLRDAAADIDEVRIGDYPADTYEAGVERGKPGKADFGAVYFTEDREPREILVLYHAPDTGRPGVLEATIERRDGSLIVVREKDGPTGHPIG